MLFRRSIVLIAVLLASSFSFGTTPQVTSTSPASGPTGSQVHINGSGFGATQGTVKFNGTYPASIATWSDTQIVVTVPVQASTGPILVTAGGIDSNSAVYFNVPPPQITSISPTSGGVGTQITINGSGFQDPKAATSTIKFNGISATVATWHDTQIVATVAANTTTGAVQVAVNGILSNQDQIFTMPNPIVSSLAPSSAPVGTVVQINGSGFGASQGTSTVQFNGVNATATVWNDSSITATVPVTATSGAVLVTVGGVPTSSSVKFTIPAPQVNSISPATGLANTQVTVNGSGFQATKGSSTLLINGTTAATSTWSDSQITATIPAGAATGPIRVSVNNISSNQDVVFTVPNPIITSISPSSGFVGAQVTVSGTGFGPGPPQGSLLFQGVSAVIHTWSDNQIVAIVPDAALTGYIQVTNSGVSSHAGDIDFTVLSPQITSISPTSGVTGTTVVTVNGSGFRNSQTAGGNTSTISFNGVNAAVTTWGANQIVATVPATATTGPVKVSGFNANSNTDIVFTTANPVITSLSPTSGPVLNAVHINGSGFGTIQGVVKFAGTSATVGTWNDTLIVATPPANAVSGAVTVIVGGVTSNSNINFIIPPPQITSITPTSGVGGTQITINGSGFQALRGSSSVSFTNGSPLNVVTWSSDTQIVATVPSVAGTNPVRVTVNGIDSNNDVEFTLPNPIVRSISPSGGPVGTPLQINGSGFGTSAVGNTVKVNGVNATIVTWSDTAISATVGTGSTTGGVAVTVGGVTSGSNPSFSVSNLFVNAVSPAAGTVGTPVTITGSGFGSSQGTSTLSFNNVAATVASGNWSNTQIVANVPTGATSGAVKVTVSGTGSNTSTIFTVGSVSVTGISPTAGSPGTTVQISGSGFGSTQGTSSVMINGWTATVNTWTDGLITTAVPASATTGPVKVTAGGVASNSTINFTVLVPLITSLSPSSGPTGTTQVQIAGSGFGTTQGSNSSFSFNGSTATIVHWTDTLITATVPDSATSGRVYVAIGSVFSNQNLNFTVPSPKILSISPTSGIVGTTVTINGSGFRASQGSSSILFNGTTASVIPPWTDTQLTVTVPAGAKTGPVTVTGSNQDAVFTMPNPNVTSLSPSTGSMNTSVQINGSGFGSSQGSSTVKFNNVSATAVWSDTLITATVPATATTGIVAVTVGGVTSSSTLNFVVPLPHVTSVTPSVGTANTQITVTGSGFHLLQGPGNVFFNNSVIATINHWSDTQIVATVPANATSGTMGVWQNLNSNWDVEFSMVSPHVTGLVPTSGPVGTQVQINGSGFGIAQGSSTVTIGAAATVVTWSDAQIVAIVPSNAQSGQVSVLVSGINSNNNLNFTVPGPRITSISPSTGAVGSYVTINGTGFQTSRGSGQVCFNAGCTTSAGSWSDTQIVVAVPAGSTSGSVRVIANNSTVSNQDLAFTMPNPIVAGLVPASGPTGTQVQVNGAGFGITQGGSTVTFNNAVASVVSWSDTQIVAVVPSTALSGPVQVSEGGVAGNAGVYFNIPTPIITSISPTNGGSGNPITITGSGFQAVQGSNSNVNFSGGGGPATIKSWSDTQIVAVVPPQTTTGFLDVAVNSTPSNYVNYTIPNQFISTLSPATGPVGTQVTVNGTAFGSPPGHKRAQLQRSASHSIQLDEYSDYRYCPCHCSSRPRRGNHQRSQQQCASV